MEDADKNSKSDVYKRQVQQSCHEEAEKSAGFKKCETDKKVQHGTPHSMQMQGKTLLCLGTKRKESQG